MEEIKISDIKGIKIGNAQNVEGATGCTAIICEKGAWAGIDVRGGGPASRETELLKPVNMVQQIHCVMLSGGSAYGLDASGGAMQYLEEKGIGFNVGVGLVPIVCGASLFDLVVGDPKCRPDKAMGYAACLAAEKGEEPEQGNFGAGTGASVGKFLGMDYMMKSGLGTYAVQIGKLQVGAIVAVNALGDVIDVNTGNRIVEHVHGYGHGHGKGHGHCNQRDGCGHTKTGFFAHSENVLPCVKVVRCCRIKAVP